MLNTEYVPNEYEYEYVSNEYEYEYVSKTKVNDNSIF